MKSIFENKWFWILLLWIVIMLWFILPLHKQKAGAWYQIPVCNADHHINCATPTPKVTLNPCQHWQEDKWEADCLTPTVTPAPSELTPTPSATPSATPVPQNDSTGGTGGGTGNNAPPIAQCVNDAFVGPVIVSFTDKGNGTVNFAWTEITGTIDKYSIIYGYSPDSLIYGQDNIPGNVWNWDIHDLAIGSHVWAKISAWKNNCAVESNLFDPIVR